MSKSTISISFAVAEGKDGFKKLTLDAAELRKVMQGTVTEAEAVKKNFINFASTAVGLDSISKSLSDISSVMQNLTDAYSVQVEAETKLETVMRQRMSAAEGEIQAIKDLCSAQQQLGVIGDEIQLAGAQQISTFLSSRAALETLIPAMNNLVAQQKGLNATSGDAVTVGNLLGKAMQGQVEALRRVGITFTEAEKKAVKFGTEEERAAALAQIITNNVGEMNAALAATPAGKMKQVSNSIGDAKEVLGGFLQNIAPSVQLANQLVTAFMNLKKINGGVMQVAGSFVNMTKQVTAANASIKMLGNTITGTDAISKSFVITVKTLGAVIRSLGGIIKSVLISTGVGIALWGIGEAVMFIVNTLNGVSDAADDAAEGIQEVASQQDKVADAVAKTSAQLANHIAAIKDFQGSKAAEKKLVDELNNTYGETMGYFSDLAEWYKALTANSETYTQQIMLEAKARVLASRLEQVEAARYKATHNADGSKKTQQQLNPIIKPGDNPFKQFGTDDKAKPGLPGFINRGFNLPQVQLDVTSNYLEYLDKTTANIMQDMRENAQKLANMKMPVIGSRTRPGDNKDNKQDKTPAPEGSIAWHEGKVSELESKMKLTIDPDSIMQMTREIEEHKRNIADLKIWVNIENGRQRMRDLYKEMCDELKNDPLKIKLQIDKGEIKNELLDIPEQFKKSQIQANNLAKDVDNIANLGRSAASAFSSLGDAMEAPMLNVAGIIAGAIANVMAGFAAASAKKGGQGNPWEWIAFAVSGLATAVATVAQIKQVTAFADGGIVSGPTMALVGEYAGARNNPEVIAPLNKLRDLIGEPGGAVQRVEVFGRIKGSDIELVQRNYSRVKRVSGRKV